MSLHFTPSLIKFAIAYIGIIILMILLGCLTKPWKFERFVIAGFIMLGLFLVWKSSVIRQGIGHVKIFFNFALIAPFFLDYNRNMSAMRLLTYRTLRYMAIFTALAGLFVVLGSTNYQPHNFIGKWNEKVFNNLHTLFNLQHKENNEKNFVNFKQQYDLPNIRKSVGQSTVDIFSWEQGVLFLNELNWHPRPVFQSYTAYTPSLIATNGDFYASDKAPEFVILKLQAIDRQFPLMNDAEAIKIVLRDYQPVLSEKGYLLLKRKPRGQGFVSKGERLLTRQIKIDELLDIRLMSHKSLLLSLDIRKSLLGHLYTLLYRLPEVYLEIVATDGTKMSYRVIPKMTTSGFVINPLIRNQAQLIGWYKGLMHSTPKINKTSQNFTNQA